MTEIMSDQDQTPEAGSREPVGSEPEDNIIARCGDCDRIVFAAANLPVVMDTDMYKEIGKLVHDGCTIEHVSTEAVRKGDWGCKC